LKTKQRRVFTLPVVMLLGWSWHTAGAQALQSFDLPAQSLADSLRAVAARTNSNILFDKNLVSGVSARPLRGRVSTEEALTTILSGTDLHAHRLDDKTVTILPSRSKPAESPGTVPGATSYVRATDIRLAQANTSTTSDYTAESTIPAKADTTRRSEASDQLESVVVTGSRLAPLGFREPTPVTVVGAEEIKLSGTVNIEQLLGDSPQFVGSQNNGATANTVPGGTATLNLRGFGAQRNLVLVNGRRFAISGPDETTDINTIPAALIQRTEIVTGGSSAVYGSDAITGVVNFIMRDDFEGVELNAQDGFDQHTRTQVYNLDITGGGKFAEGRGNVVVSANFLNRGAISRGDRGDWAFDSLSDGCVTPASSNRSHAGVPVAISSG
jgi:hypothetical protein